MYELKIILNDEYYHELQRVAIKNSYPNLESIIDECLGNIIYEANKQKVFNSIVNKINSVEIHMEFTIISILKEYQINLFTNKYDHDFDCYLEERILRLKDKEFIFFLAKETKYLNTYMRIK